MWTSGPSPITYPMFFLKTPWKEEIDIIHTRDGNVVPVEIKIKEKIDKGDVKTLFKFLEKNDLRKAVLITLNTETAFKKDKIAIEAVPYWKHWTIRSRLN